MNPTRFSALLAGAVLFSAVIAGTTEAGSGQAAEPVPRKILALYKLHTQPPQRGGGPEEPDVVDTPIHRHAEVILNHLGLEVVYHSVDDPLPEPKALKGFLGILTWFEGIDDAGDAEGYCTWARERMEEGFKLVILGTPGVFKNESRRMPQVCEEMFETLGASHQNKFSNNPFYLEVVKKDPAMVEFERKLLLTEGAEYDQYRAQSPGAKLYLKMRRRDLEQSESDLVFTTPRGGFAHAGYVHYEVREPLRIHWRLNPFWFFEEAFGIKGRPRPDTTTIEGKRIFYAHIDGDGIFNVSRIDNETYSGRIILEEILKKYPSLPATVSIITGYLDQRRYQGEKERQLYRELFSLPHVEAASHGHAHPFVWRRQKLALKVPGYRYSDRAEIAGSAQRLRNLLKGLGINKPVELFLWTGDARPNENQLAVPARAGLINLNGGDSRFDARYDSYAFLHPLGILRGSHRQIYASAPNENVYTEGWKGSFFGLRKVLETFRNTEHPIRIKPINIYYHYYSGELIASLKALQEIYDWALTQEIHPVFASDYAKIVEDFFAVEMIPQGSGKWEIRNRGLLRTLRFDHEQRRLDFKRSQGVTGSRFYQGSLYVFLDKSRRHTIVLK